MASEQRLNSHLTDPQIEILKGELIAAKDRIYDNLKNNSAELRGSEVETKDSVDEANDNILVWQKARFNNRENLFLKKILKSLEKMNTGEYGICEECGNNIPFKRLEARLTSEMCIVCKEEAESSERHNVFQRKSQSLGKALHEIR